MGNRADLSARRVCGRWEEEESMLLYLVRHGKAEEGTDDAARRLTRQGSDIGERVAQRLATAGIEVERIEHSGLARAAETADILAKALGSTCTATSGLRPSHNVASAAMRLNSHRE